MLQYRNAVCVVPGSLARYVQQQNDYLDHIRVSLIVQSTHCRISLDHVQVYRKFTGDTESVFKAWSAFEDWLGRAAATKGDTFRKHAEESHYQKGSAGATSRYDYRSELYHSVQFLTLMSHQDAATPECCCEGVCVCVYNPFSFSLCYVSLLLALTAACN